MRRRLLTCAWIVGVAACGRAPATVFTAIGRDCTIAEPPASATTAALEDPLGRASVRASGSQCLRSYELATTGPVRVGDVVSPGAQRTVVEREGDPFARTGNPMFDGLYALALDELRALEVDSVADPAFDGGHARPCGVGGCYRTGEAWPWIWTRNAGYAVALAGIALDLPRAQNALTFKISPRRDGSGAPQLVQDVGTGGSYPIAIDRVAWALGAERLLELQPPDARAAFAATTEQALLETIRADRAVAYDATLGLYRGEASFLNNREQLYGPSVKSDPTPIANSFALSSNVLELRALELVAALARELGDVAALDETASWSLELRRAIAARFRGADGTWGAYLPSRLDPTPVGRVDLLGLALAIDAGLVDPDEGRRLLGAYPRGRVGPPVLWPEDRDVPVFHNRGVWPFVIGEELRAARRVGHDGVVDQDVAALVRAAALSVSNIACFDVLTGDPRVPIVSGRRELWSVAAYLSMVQDVVFGVELAGGTIRVRPTITAHLHRTLLASSSRIALGDFALAGKRVSIVVHLPPVDDAASGPYGVASVSLDGHDVGDRPLARSELASRSRIDVRLVRGRATPTPPVAELPSASVEQAFYAPRTPSITKVQLDGDAVAVTIGAPPEDPAIIVYDVRRDGVSIARDLPGGTSKFVDASAGMSSPSYCYTVEARFPSSGLRSPPSTPVCYWGPATRNRVQQVTPAMLDGVGGTRTMVDGRAVIALWGAPGEELVLPRFDAVAAGEHLIQLVGGNASGPVDDGVTCAVKEIVVERLPGGESVGGGVVAIAHQDVAGRIVPSTFARAVLEAGVSYRVRVRDVPNMSYLAHYEGFAGLAPHDGPWNRVDVAELRILTRVAPP